MSSKPKVSLIMPNYNYALYLEDALDAVVGQTYRDFELILIDDASTDDSVKLIKPYVEKYPFIRFIQHSTNQGFYRSVLEGLDLSVGKYVSFPSSDDVLFPEFLEKKAALLDAHEDIGLCFSKFATFNSDQPKKLITNKVQKPYEAVKLKPRDLVTQIKNDRVWIPGNTVLCRKKLFIEQEGFHPKYGSLTDWFVFLRIAFLYGSYYLPDVYGALRVHTSSLSATESLEKKIVAWKNMIASLSQRKNRRLKRAFLKSHVFNIFGEDFYRFALKNPKYWLFFKQQTWKHFLPALKKASMEANKNA